MGKIWDYLSIRANRALSIKQVMSLAMLAVGIFHVLLLLFFGCFKIYPMVIVNICSIALYIYCYRQVRRGKNLLRIFNLAYIEIVLHAVIAVLLLGVDSGFTLYMIAMLPLGYYAAYNFSSKDKNTNPMFYVAISGLAFIFVRITCVIIEPLYSYGNKQVDRVIYMVNYFVAVAAVVAFFSTLLNQIKLLEKLRLAQNKQLETLSKIDPLTGLTNRRSIQERYKQADILKEEYALIMGDLDDFKKVNDTYGHDMGDVVLKAVADIFKEAVGNEEVVCRWGGEEILMFLPKQTKDDAAYVAGGILERIRQLKFYTQEHKVFSVTMTLGVAASVEGAEFDDVLKKADERLYDGKHKGKNRVVYQ